MSDVIDRVETADAFMDWLQIAKPREVCVYHVGLLSKARLTDTGVHKLGLAALRAAGYRYVSPKGHDRTGAYLSDGKPIVALVQKRCPQGLEYRAVRL